MNAPSLARFLGQAVIWGGSFTLIKIALEDVGPGLLVAGRLVIGAAVLAAFAGVRRVPLRLAPKTWLHVAISAVFANVIPYLLLNSGERTVSAGLAGVLIGATPVLTLLIARLALPDAPAGRRRMVGFVVAFAGVVLVVAPWSAPGGSLLGALQCFGAAVSYAVGYVYVRRFISPLGIEPVTLAANQLIAAAVIMVPLALTVLYRPVGPVSVEAILAIVVLGALSTGLANILYFRLIQDIGAAGAAAVDYVVPVVAVAIGVLALGEALTWNVVAGGLVVLAGMALAEGRRVDRSRAGRPRPPGTGAPRRRGAGVSAGRSRRVSRTRAE